MLSLVSITISEILEQPDNSNRIGLGLQVRFTYNLSLLRNDASLFKYGFVQQQDPPRLCGVDLPGGYLGGVQEGPPWEYYAGGRLATRAEHARLTKLLPSFPTSEEEDSRILKSAPRFLPPNY